MCSSQSWPRELVRHELGDWRLIDTLTVCLYPKQLGYRKVLYFRKLMPSGRFVPWRYRIRTHPDVLFTSSEEFWQKILLISKGMFKTEPLCFEWNLPANEKHGFQPVDNTAQSFHMNLVDFSSLTNDDVMNLSSSQNVKEQILFPRLNDDVPSEF